MSSHVAVCFVCSFVRSFRVEENKDEQSMFDECVAEVDASESLDEISLLECVY